MNGFNLNIDLFYASQLEKGLEVKAIAAIEYPVLHIIATTLESAEESYDKFDRFLITEVVLNGLEKISELSKVTGIKEDVFRKRASVLNDQGYLIYTSGDRLRRTDEAFEWIQSPVFDRVIRKTRSFLLDGQDHKPLTTYFYKEGKDYFISEDKKDANGKKVFNPSLIHNPPAVGLKNNILQLNHATRAAHHIPLSLKDLIDYDVHLLTFPTAIVMALNKAREPVKYLVNCNGFYGDLESMENWQKKLKEEIINLTVGLEENYKTVESGKPAIFRSSWGSREPATNIIFRKPEKTKLISLITKHYELETIPDEMLEFNAVSINLKITRDVLFSAGMKKKALLEALSRGRDYFFQPPHLGVWLVFFNVIPADEFIEELTAVYKTIKEGLPFSDLLARYQHNFPKLRSDLVQIGAFDYLEELDIYLFMHSRENPEILRFKTNEHE